MNWKANHSKIDYHQATAWQKKGLSAKYSQETNADDRSEEVNDTDDGCDLVWRDSNVFENGVWIEHNEVHTGKLLDYGQAAPNKGSSAIEWITENTSVGFALLSVGIL